MGFTRILPIQDRRPRAQTRQVKQFDGLLHVIRASMAISTWLSIGGLLQGVSLLLLPYWWTLLPTVLILLYRSGTTLLITLKLIPNPYLEGSVHEWASGQLPNTKTGEFSSTPADQKVAVLHLGAKYNHPLGPFAPHGPTLGDFAGKMYAALDYNKATNGYLGGKDYTTIDSKGAIEYTFIAYFRNIDDIHNFAYSDAHRAGWEWWNSVPAEEIKHLGINHEVFLAREGDWETIFINCQPTMLGGTHSLIQGDKVQDGWITNLVKARGPLRTSAGRLGWNKEALTEKTGYVPHAVTGIEDQQRQAKSEKA